MAVSSKRHREIYEYLRKKYPALKIEQEYNMGNNLFIDIFITDLKIAIEIDGIQHDKFVEFFHKSQLNFEEQKFRDKKKRSSCNMNSVFIFSVKSHDKREPEELINFIFDSASKFHQDYISWEDPICSNCNKNLVKESNKYSMCIDCRKSLVKEKKYKARQRKYEWENRIKSRSDNK